MRPNLGRINQMLIYEEMCPKLGHISLQISFRRFDKCQKSVNENPAT